jgi:predicted TIM-barrel fold metal-dependent hydrolase
MRNGRLVRMVAVVSATASAVACRGSQAAITLSQAAFEKIDVHTHYFAPRSYLVPMLDRWHARAVILNYSLGQPDSLVRRRWASVLALAHSAPDRFWVATTFDPTSIDQPDFAPRTLARLRTDIADGAVMLKVWKDLGLTVRDRSGRFVQIDDPRLQPIWDFISARHIPVIEHSADPREGWRRLEPRSPNYHYFKANPEYYPYLHPEMPRWDTVIAARNRWLARNPDLTVIGAHFGSMADDLDGLSRCLDSFPNFNVDVSARLADIERLPAERVRRFFLAYPDRILFGTDRSTSAPEAAVDPAALGEEQRQTEAQYAGWWHYATRTLRLPPPVLAKFFAGNARRLLHLSSRGSTVSRPKASQEHPPEREST